MSKVKTLTCSELKELQDVYKTCITYASNVNSLLITYFKWKKLHPERDYLKFYALGDDWKRSGTFIMMFRTFDIFPFTLDKSGKDLDTLLNESKVLKPEPKDWLTIIYGVIDDHLPSIYKSLQHLGTIIHSKHLAKIYWLSKEDALKYSLDCPDEIYIGKINLSHLNLILSLWPHAYAGAFEYLSSFIEMNGGYGIFLKENNQLVSWVLQNHWGTLIVLETVPEFKRRGYGSLIVKKMCKEIAMDGINPMCTIVNGNYVSESLFSKLGFKYITDCTFCCIK